MKINFQSNYKHHAHYSYHCAPSLHLAPQTGKRFFLGQEGGDKEEEMERQRYDFSYHMVDELTWMGLRAQLHKWRASQVSRAVREGRSNCPLSFSLSLSPLPSLPPLAENVIRHILPLSPRTLSRRAKRKRASRVAVAKTFLDTSISPG